MARTSKLEDVVIKATRKVGRMIKAQALDYGDLAWKSTDDPVTSMDREGERIIRDIAKRKLGASVIGEEYDKQEGTSDITLYVDPIDGTKSYIRGEFLSSVSVAAEKGEELVMGCVYDFMRDIMYLSTEEKATMIIKGKEHLLPLKNKPTFSKPTIYCTGKEDYQTLDKEASVNARWCIGSIALSMAQLAAGAYEAIVLTPYEKDGKGDTADITAGYHLLKSAGYTITDRFGNPYDYQQPSKGMIAVLPEYEKEVQDLLIEKEEQEKNTSLTYDPFMPTTRSFSGESTDGYKTVWSNIPWD